MHAAPCMPLLESNVNPRDTSPSANQKLVRQLITYTVSSSVTWLFKSSLPKAELAVFWALSQLSFSLPGPAINPSPLQTPAFQFVWEPCASGARTCARRRVGERLISMNHAFGPTDHCPGLHSNLLTNRRLLSQWERLRGRVARKLSRRGICSVLSWLSGPFCRVESQPRLPAWRNARTHALWMEVVRSKLRPSKALSVVGDWQLTLPLLLHDTSPHHCVNPFDHGAIPALILQRGRLRVAFIYPKAHS